MVLFDLYEKSKSDDITTGKRNTYITSPSNWLLRMCSRTNTTTSDSTVSQNVHFDSVDCSYANRFRVANFLSNIRVEIMEMGSACRVCVLSTLESVVDVVTSVQYNQNTARIFIFSSNCKACACRTQKSYEGFVWLFVMVSFEICGIVFIDT